MSSFFYSSLNCPRISEHDIYIFQTRSLSILFHQFHVVLLFRQNQPYFTIYTNILYRAKSYICSLKRRVPSKILIEQQLERFVAIQFTEWIKIGAENIVAMYHHIYTRKGKYNRSWMQDIVSVGKIAQILTVTIFRIISIEFARIDLNFFFLE